MGAKARVRVQAHVREVNFLHPLTTTYNHIHPLVAGGDRLHVQPRTAERGIVFGLRLAAGLARRC